MICDIFNKYLLLSVDGAWGKWSGFTGCTVSCDGGESHRTRLCNNPKPAYGGKKCKGSGKETKKCNQQPCPGMEFEISCLF